MGINSRCHSDGRVEWRHVRAFGAKMKARLAGEKRDAFTLGRHVARLDTSIDTVYHTGRVRQIAVLLPVT